MDTQTLIFFVAHASLLVRYGDAWLLTDPWFYNPAFSTWVPSPPPAMNPDMLVGLAGTGRLGVVISHAHPDHLDLDFLARLPANTPVFVPKYGDDHLISQLGDFDVTELGSAEFHGFALHGFEHHDSPYDAAISIETPDAFVFHGNDSWTLGEAARVRLRQVKPIGKPSVFAGQGTSASGYPLTYRNIADPDAALRQKNENMLRALHDTAIDLDFDRALAYACFTKIGYRDYAFRAPTSHGTYANEVTGDDLFIDLSPGDVYIPTTAQVIPITTSLHIDQRLFPHPPSATSWPDVDAAAWAPYREKLAAFVSGVPASEVRFVVEVAIGDDIIDRVQTGEGPRSKTCRVDASTMAAVLDKVIPFEDLYTGYLAEWVREPPDVYNRQFLMDLIDYGYRYQSSG